MAKRFFGVLVSGLLVIALCVPAWATADGLYTATTKDGITLKMLHYRPAADAPFRTGQPVLLFNGILTNFNEYLTHTPEERQAYYGHITLPTPLADWAAGDEYIQADPLRYYSLAHYLWVKGYDPWLCNYRGTGRGEFHSQNGNCRTNLDIWGILDTEACVDKVIAVTGQNPFIGGHSTGGFACYAYLQGAKFDLDELKAGYANGYIPHVISDPALARIRNGRIKGFIAIDPGLTPWVPAWTDFPLMWKTISQPVYLDFDDLMDKVVNPLLPDGVLAFTLEKTFGIIGSLDSLYGYSPYISWIIPYLDFWEISNTSPYVADFFGRYGFTSTYMRGVSQWYDLGICNRVREHWTNGKENKDLIEGPTPAAGDGYYYYDTNMHLVSVPTMAVLSYLNGIVQAEDVITMLMDAKTKSPYDVAYLIPNTGHADIPLGLNAPYITFPYIGAWLDKVCSATTTATSDAATDEGATANQAMDDGAGGGSSGGMCFLASAGI